MSGAFVSKGGVRNPPTRPSTTTTCAFRLTARRKAAIVTTDIRTNAVNAALANQSRFDEMKEFFGDVGEGHAAGIWEDTPNENVAFREKYKKQIEAQAKKRKAEEMI